MGSKTSKENEEHTLTDTGGWKAVVTDAQHASDSQGEAKL